MQDACAKCGRKVIKSNEIGQGGGDIWISSLQILTCEGAFYCKYDHNFYYPIYNRINIYFKLLSIGNLPCKSVKHLPFYEKKLPMQETKEELL